MAYHIFIEGGLGAGKTLMMSTLAHHWRYKVRQAGGDIALFSNYDLKDSSNMLNYQDWYDVAKAQGSICCWDEAQMAFDSRQALKSKSVYATQLLMYVRKMKSIQIYCSPSINNIDSRIRQVVEVLVSVSKRGNRGIVLNFFDYQSKQFGANGKFLHSQIIPRWKLEQIYKQNLYDTHNMVQGFPLPNTQRQADDFFEKLEDIHNAARGKVKLS
ncbi:zonular occludens toxin domain-containing protein [Tenuibacillus multivorans]|uniref:Zonular occludens toxin (Zot) n=1 Tax=Tenuibacillus multivorans TaxID=237069 RepID=A0A1H0DG35_9BACI|nr:zonular occludens toxin domain-containing protein [Tenuibacillus multivorans]GEL76572.1 hypothetical protein TMU01_08070 [Tenuibacillus multivorans]SDN68966.1 Zonular occludens toxin (Zot) [Tenuibacillus multivorans]